MTVGGRVAQPDRTRPARLSPELRRFAVIALVALLVRAALAVPALGDVKRFYVAPDSYEYDQLATNIADGLGYSQATVPPYTPDVRRTPGFPLMLAAVYAVGGNQPAVAVAANVLVGIVTCVLTTVLGSRVYGTLAGTLAGLLLAVDLTSAAYSLTIMAEPLFTLLLVVTAFAAVEYARRGSTRTLAQSAILCGVATLIRPIGVFLPLGLGSGLSLLPPRRSMRTCAAAASMFVLLGLLLPLGWVARNYLAAGVVQLTSVAAINALYHRAAAVEAQRRGVPIEVVRRELVQAGATGAGPAPGERPEALAAMERDALQIVLADPGGYLVAHLGGVVRMLGPDREVLAQLESGNPADEGLPASVAAFITADSVGHVQLGGRQLVLAGAQLAVVYALALVGLGVGLRRESWRQGTIVVSLYVLYLLLASGPEAYARFRVPAMPFIVILAAGGALIVLRRVGATPRPAPMTACSDGP